MTTKETEILETASLLFSQRGIKRTSIEQIANGSNISKKTLYQCFASKEILVLEIVRNLLSKTEQYIRMLPEISTDATSELVSFFQYMQINVFVFKPLFIYDLKKFYPEIHNMIMLTRIKKFLPFFIENIERGISEGIYRKYIDGKLTAELYFYQMDHAMEADSIKNSDRYQVLNYINSFFLHGIINEKGQKVLFNNFR
ncbi:TetR/AcrR family transcriptional regulator [Flavobacterium sp. CSZ]|uniref:TetR/AcrR family transcriptional regulator n=1 Tax=Flavobacterium sp. CSZ TaxID=2783791 RepID=UPI00188C6661|nr:TetR/AcrR family transcriptional regulator [Flavobacterium sp. CSZ]MBF4485726.1 TetR/AcrR family transcriptional regulator [Flavobacterium sp. CSZ]